MTSKYCDGRLNDKGNGNDFPCYGWRTVDLGSVEEGVESSIPKHWRDRDGGFSIQGNKLAFWTVELTA